MAPFSGGIVPLAFGNPIAALDASGQPNGAPLPHGLLCNEATMTSTGPVGGNTLDAALWRAPAAATLTGTADDPSRFERLGSLPFDHDRQLASVVVRHAGATLLITKGAPEVVLARCADPPPVARSTLDRLFADGARVVAVAHPRRATG